MPQSSAWRALMRRERMTMSLVRVMPTIFCSRADPPEPGIWPSFCSGSAYSAGLRGEAEVAGEAQLEADAEAVAAVGGDDRLGGAGRGGDVPGELADVLGRGLEEALDVAAAAEMLAVGADHDDPHPVVFVQRLERAAQLVALAHVDDVVRRAVEHDVAALRRAASISTRKPSSSVSCGRACRSCELFLCAGRRGIVLAADELAAQQLADRRFRDARRRRRSGAGA